MSKALYILRGVSGCGKTTLANQLCEMPNTVSWAADDYHYDDGNYNWLPENLKLAHNWCRDMVRNSMELNYNIVVHNTNTSEKELKPYLDMAEKFGYKVASLVVENRHGNKDVHNVPQEVRDGQEKRLRDSLKLQGSSL